MLPDGWLGLLIADECHHYGSRSWSVALQHGFQHRLGLTATYEREDDGLECFLNPYFGEVRYSVAYDEALADGVIAPFKIAFVGVSFEPGEAQAYEESSEKLNRYRRRLIHEFSVPAEPFGVFIREVSVPRHASGPASRLAGFYLSAFTKRRAVLAGAVQKLQRLRQLAPAVRAADRTIVFTQTHEAAQGAVSVLREVGIGGAVLDSTMDMSDRESVFAAFEDGTHELVAAPRLLDEGVDVPSADLALVLASSRSTRQMIQRMGRVIRPKADGRIARIAIFFVENSSEDPETGTHEDFIDIITTAAEDVQVFRSGHDNTALIRYLRPRA